MIVTAIQYVRTRPLMFIMAAIGATFFATFFFRAEDTRQQITGKGGIKERITKQERSNPCNDLTTRQCAVKLFRSLPPESRRAIEQRVVTEEKRVARLEARERIRNRAVRETAPGTTPSRSDRGDSGSSGTSQSSPSTPEPSGSAPSGGGSGSSSGGGAGGSGQPPSEPSPTIKGPVIDIPPIGGMDIPPITIPDVPCIPTPATQC